MFKKLLSLERLKPAASYLIIFLVPFVIFCWHLKKQLPGISAAEAATRTGAKLSVLRQNELFLPYKLVFNLFYHLGRGHIFAMRLTSVFFGILFTIMIFNVLKAWFGKPIALLTTLLMALTPTFLIVSRTATPAILFVSSIALLYCYYIVSKNRHKPALYGLFVLCLGLCLYIPGFVYLFLISGLFWRKEIFSIFKDRTRTESVSAGVILLITIIPLLASFIDNSSQVKDWLLIPDKFHGFVYYLKSFMWSVSGLFIKTKSIDALNVGHIPLFNAAQTGLFIFGAFIMWERLRKPFYWLMTSLVATLILAALNNSYELLLMSLPIVSFICGMGLRYLFVEWRRIFPRNPLAKAFAISLMSILIFMHILYGVRYSLIAWPANPEIKKIYVLK